MFKGLLVNKKKGPLSDVTKDNLLLLERPFVEQDPTVPQHVKDITEQDIQEWVDGFNNNIISGSITGDNDKTVTLTKRDGSTLQFSFTDNEGAVTGDDVLNTLGFDKDTGILTAVTSEGVQITTNLDGRYALLDHTHDFDKYDYWTVQVNGGDPSNMSSKDVLNLIEGTDVTIVKSGKSITINSTYSFNFSDDLSDGIEVKSGDTIRVSARSSNSNLKTDREGDTIFIERLPKPVFNVGGNLMTVSNFGSRYYNNLWFHVKPTASGNPTPNFTIRLNGNGADVVKGLELEGTFNGTGTLTIEGINGVTLIYPEEYFTNTYPAGGVFGIKMVSDTEAHIFGTLKPIGL